MSKQKPGKPPTDHKPKTPKYETVDVEVGDGENTRTIPARRADVLGLTLTIEERRLNDYRVSNLMAKARRGDPAAGVEALIIIVGEDQHEQIMEHCADDEGFISQEDIGDFITAMFKAVSPNS